jgi:geranylgeranylglycerol-phosphate geranylgeranyltransferase
MTTPTSSGRASSSESDGRESAKSCAPALVSLVRPANGAFVSVGQVDWGSAALGALATFAAAGAANALNDLRDVVSDRVNRPARPLPAGRLTVGAAATVAVSLYVASIALAACLGSRALLLAGSWVVLTALYAFALKGVPLFGNLVVAAVAASPLLMGGVTQGTLALADRATASVVTRAGAFDERGLLMLFGLAALLHMARELVKDVEDVAGDKAAGITTFAATAGTSASLTVARVLLVLSMWAATVPFTLGLMGWGYLALLVPIEGALAWLLVESSRAVEGEWSATSLRRVSNGLKAVMVLGLAAFAAGAI